MKKIRFIENPLSEQERAEAEARYKEFKKLERLLDLYNINDMQSIIKEANITDKDTIEKIMCLKDDISKHVKLIESLHNEKEAKIEFEKIFKLHFIDIAMTYPQAYNGIANNQILKEKLKEVIFEAIKQENTESIARKDFSNKALQNTESKQKLDLKAKKQSLLTFSMKNISLSHKQHKSLTDYKHIDSFNSVIEKRVIKAVIAKERSPPKAKAKSGAEAGRKTPRNPAPPKFFCKS